jgi:carboxylesterase type B
VFSSGVTSSIALISVLVPGVLFHRAILMSGSALSPWALIQEPSRYAAQVAIHANCSPELPHPHLLKCLRERPLETLLSTPVIAPEFAFAFGPSVDGVVIDTGEPPGNSTFAVNQLFHGNWGIHSMILLNKPQTEPFDAT